MAIVKILFRYRGCAELETYTAVKALVPNPHYLNQRRECLAGLNSSMIDEPIADLIDDFNKLPCCFTLQSCYGHFTCRGRENPQNLDPLPATAAVAEVTYRIAYVALCIENSRRGKRLFNALQEITGLDPANIQFCCAEWFWQRQVNSYALQVEPDRFKQQDTAILGYTEALRIERLRNQFFAQLRQVLETLR